MLNVSRVRVWKWSIWMPTQRLRIGSWMMCPKAWNVGIVLWGLKTGVRSWKWVKNGHKLRKMGVECWKCRKGCCCDFRCYYLILNWNRSSSSRCKVLSSAGTQQIFLQCNRLESSSNVAHVLLFMTLHPSLSWLPMPNILLIQTCCKGYGLTLRGHQETCVF